MTEGLAATALVVVREGTIDLSALKIEQGNVIQDQKTRVNVGTVCYNKWRRENKAMPSGAWQR